MQIEKTISRIEALQDYLIESKQFTAEETRDIKPTERSKQMFEVAGREYLVLTDKEADEHLHHYIKDTVWAFNPEFLEAHTGIDRDVFKLLQDKCEDSNDVILRLIIDFEGFCNDAVLSDGRGHFLNHYDGTEEQSNDLFIYRTN